MCQSCSQDMIDSTTYRQVQSTALCHSGAPPYKSKLMVIFPSSNTGGWRASQSLLWRAQHSLTHHIKRRSMHSCLISRCYSVSYLGILLGRNIRVTEIKKLLVSSWHALKTKHLAMYAPPVPWFPLMIMCLSKIKSNFSISNSIICPASGNTSAAVLQDTSSARNRPDRR